MQLFQKLYEPMSESYQLTTIISLGFPLLYLFVMFIALEQ